MVLPVTLVTAAACAVINIWLAVRLVRGRMRGKVMVGDGGDPAMLSGMRAHANFIEYAPIVLILMGLIEFARGPLVGLWALGILFVIARVAHPLGMARNSPNPLRAGGALVTWVVTLVLAGWAIAIVVDSPAARPVIVVPVESVPHA